MNIIVFDTETSGLLAPGASDLSFQPYMVEFAGIKFGNDFERLDTLTFRVKPPIPIPDDAIKIHHIRNEDVADCYSFGHWYRILGKFFQSSDIIVGHNALFDQMVIHYELMRIGRQLRFPWPMNLICTAEVSSQQHGFRQNLTDLHIELFGCGFESAHSAGVDCEVTAKCFIELVKRKVIEL